MKIFFYISLTRIKSGKRNLFSFLRPFQRKNTAFLVRLLYSAKGVRIHVDGIHKTIENNNIFIRQHNIVKIKQTKNKYV